jgi:glycosyltransferase involved in cell wall biosynthesis
MNRILLVPSSDYLGHPFPQRHNQIFERLHDEKNFEVHVVRFKLFDKPHLKTELIIHELGGMRISKAAPYYFANSIDQAYQIRRIIKKEGIDVVVLSNLASPFAYTLMNQLTRSSIPIIIDLPDYFPTSATGYLFDSGTVASKLLTGTFNSMLRYMMRRASAVTVASHALGEYAKVAGANRVVHVPNGVGEGFLELHDGNDLREKLGYSKEDFVVGYIGSLEFWLDMKSLIKGVSIAKRKGVPIKLLIVGGKLVTNYSENLSNWVKQEKVEEETQFLDFIPYELVPEYISAFDVGTIPFDVLNPTAYYSAPNKMWEYLSQRKPVFCSPIPEALYNSDCILIGLTAEDYARQFLLVFKKNAEVLQKVEMGYQKALNKTWTNSARLFGSTVYSLLNQAQRAENR